MPSAAGALVALLVWVLPIPARADCEIKTLDLPVRISGSRAIATVGINGTPVPLTVDSGAFFSSLTEAAAEQLKLSLSPNFGLRVEGVTGGIQTYLTRVDKLQLLKGDIPNVEFLVGGNEPGAGTMGLMGRNILAFTDMEYDLAHGVIRFVFPSDDCAKSNMAYWAGSTPVAEVELLNDSRNRKAQAIRARLKLNGSELVALFDTGATTIVSARAARRAGVAETAMTPSGKMYGAGRGNADLWTAEFDRLEVGDEAVLHNRLLVGDFDLPDADMLLGIDFFLSHRIYISKRQSRAYFTYGGGPVFALSRSEAAGAVAAAAAPEPDSAASAVLALTADQLARRGAASAARGNNESALADLDRACELDPTSADFHAQRGTIQEALRHPAKALGDFDQALELDPTLADARARRAWLRFQAKNHDGATADLDLLDQTLAPQAQMRLSMATLYLNLDQPARALTQLNQWLAAHPHEVKRDVALNGRCWIRARLGIELKEAIDDCDDAIDAESKNPNYLDSRGWVYWRLGRYQKALSDFDRSIEYRPAGAWSLYGRGLTRARLGDIANSEIDLAAARKLQPDIDARVERAGFMTAPLSKP